MNHVDTDKFKDPEHQILLQNLMINSARCTNAMKRGRAALVWNLINSVAIVVVVTIIYLIK